MKKYYILLFILFTSVLGFSQPSEYLLLNGTQTIKVPNTKYVNELKLKNRTVDINSNDDVLYKRKNRKISVNYFSMFTGFKNLNNRFEKIKENDKQLERFCFTSTCSLQATREILEKEILNQPMSLFIYLSVNELNKLIKRVNQKLEESKKMKKLDMDIKLSQKDKKFIKAMQ